MKRSWTVLRAALISWWSALGVVLIGVAALTGCNDYGNTFQAPTGASVDFIAPSQASAGGPAFTLTVTSQSGGFVGPSASSTTCTSSINGGAQTVIQWNGKTLPTCFVSASQVTATVPASLIAKPGVDFVNTLQPHSGAGTNGLSNTISFLVNPAANPVPAITSISPSTAAAGSASFTLSVNGSSFLPSSNAGGSQVHWNAGPTQSSLPIVNITSTQIQATVDSSLLVNSTGQPVTATITVYNPPAPPGGSGGNVPTGGGGGGGTSPNGLPFTITPAGTGGASMARSAVEETPAISIDGRYVAYSAEQSDHTQVFVRDTCEGAAPGCQPRTLLLSAGSDGTAGNDDSRSPSISGDGRYVAFSSAATNLVSGAPAGRQVYLRDTCFGAASSSCTPSTQLVSTDAEGALVGTESILPSVSSTGRFVAFLAVTPAHNAGKSSAQTKPAAAATNSGYRQVFVRDTCLGASSCTPKTTRISLQPGDTSSSEARPAGPALSGSSARVALSDAGAATLFTRSVAVDDRVFLALTSNPH
jgi:WD40-like Beta Propeller Repeat